MLRRLPPWILGLSLVGCKASGSAVDGGAADAGNTPGLLALASCTDGLVGLRISCDGTQSSDAGGRTLLYAWSGTGTPNGSTQTPTRTGPTFSFAPTARGTPAITLRVTTPHGGSPPAKGGGAAPTVAAPSS